MAGPSIAKAEVTVDLDGKRIPAEAKALGEEAGAAMGEAHSKAFNEEVEKGYGDLRDATEEDLRKTGKLAGDGSGNEFSKAFRSAIRADASNLNHDLAGIFGHIDGIDVFHDSLKKSGDDLLDIEGTVDRIDRMLIEASDNGSLNAFQMEQLSQEAHAWGDSMKEAVGEYRGLQGQRLDQVLDDLAEGKRREKDMADEADTIRGAFQDINEQRLNGVLDDLRDSRDEADRFHGALGTVKGDLKELSDKYALDLANELDDMFEGNGNLEGYRQSLQRVRGEFVGVDEVVKHASDKVDEFGRASGASEGHLNVFRGRIKEFASDAEHGVVGVLGDIVGGFEEVGRGAEKAGPKAEGFGKKLEKAFRGFSQFDPADNMGQLFLVILSFAGPAAVLIGALGAQLVVLGTAAAGGLVGVGLLVAAFQGMTGPLGKLPAQVRPAAAAFQALKDPLLKLQDQLQISVFSGLAGPFKELGKALPKLAPGVTAIGSALQGFLKGLTEGIVSNIGGINKLLEGFAPIVGSLGGALTNLIGVFGGLFKAAMPFAQDFAGSLDKTIGKWSDWINSIKGQKALQQWFTDAKPVMDALGGVLKDAGTAFGKLITPQTISDTKTLLGDIGSLVGSLGQIGGALSPAVTAIGGALAVVGRLVASLSPVANGIGVLAEGVVALLSPVIDFITKTLSPIFELVGDALATLGNGMKALAPVYEGFWSGASAMVKPVIGFIHDVYEGILDFINKGIKIAAPALQAMGDAFSDIGGAIGEFLGGITGAEKQTGLFKGTAKGASDFLNGPFKSAVSGVTGFFKDISAEIKNDVIPSIKEIDWTKVTKGIDTLTSTVPDIIDAIGTVATAFGAGVSAGAAWASSLITSAHAVISGFGDVGKVIDDVLRGDFVAAARDGATAMTNIKNNTADLKAKVADAMTKTKKAIDDTNEAQKHLGTDAGNVRDKVKSAFKDFSEAGAGNLKALSGKMGLTGEDAGKFRGVVQEAAKKAGVSLKDLADAKSLPDLEKRLGITGTAAQTNFEAKIKAATGGAGTAIDKLPPKVQAVIGKMLQLDGQKANPHIGLTGDTTAISKVDAVAAALRRVNGSTATVSIISRQVGQGTAAVGGIMAGGQLIAGGRYAFAGGGIVSSPFSFGNVLTGESGAEAIVPLSRPLSQVDPSVRNLAAYAQGMHATGNKEKGGAYVAPGAVVIQSPAADGRIVAEQVVDRLVPIL